jgi:hypothetical protein
MKISFDLNYKRTSTTFNESELFIVGQYIQLTSSYCKKYPHINEIVNHIKWKLQETDTKLPMTPKNQLLLKFRTEIVIRVSELLN